ncbi:MAG TPA: isochorismatase family protein [Candidatus Deferrimicrobiaceae bacterium]|jgi:nicotinamidase-related amidase
MVDFMDMEKSVLVVVDIQERLVGAIDPELYRIALKNTQILIEAAGTLSVPIVVTEQYPKGLGRTVAEVEQALEGKPISRYEKSTFSCARDEGFLSHLGSLGRKHAILVGMETHVCVYQTAIDLMRAGYSVFVIDDAVSSRFRHNYESGLRSMIHAGAVVFSTETALFSLLKRAGTPEFKKISSLLK